MSEIFKFNNGDKVQDSITGFAGIITARTEWLNGCIRYVVQPDHLDKDGKIQDGAPFDESQLVLVTAKAKVTRDETAERTGGPRGPAEANMRPVG